MEKLKMVFVCCVREIHIQLKGQERRLEEIQGDSLRINSTSINSNVPARSDTKLAFTDVLCIQKGFSLSPFTITRESFACSFVVFRGKINEIVLQQQTLRFQKKKSLQSNETHRSLKI